MTADLNNAAFVLETQNRLARSGAVGHIALACAELDADAGGLFAARLRHFSRLALRGQWGDAEDMWRTVNGMGRDWPRYVSRQGDAEFQYAQFCFYRGTLNADQLDEVEQLARAGRTRGTLRKVHALRGRWLLASGEWAAAADTLGNAIRMAHESGRADTRSQTRLALARFHLGKLDDPRQEAIHSASLSMPDHLALAELWRAIGESGRGRQACPGRVRVGLGRRPPLTCVHIPLTARPPYSTCSARRSPTFPFTTPARTRNSLGRTRLQRSSRSVGPNRTLTGSRRQSTCDPHRCNASRA